MSALLYAATAFAILWLTHRHVRPMTRGAALVLLVLPLALTGVALFTGGVYGPVDHLYQHDPLRVYAQKYGIGPAGNASATDIASEFFPWRRAVQESLRRGEFPAWTAYNMCGEPLVAEAQSAPFSPFTWLAVLLPAAQSMTYTAAIVLFLAAWGAFLLARELGRSEAASLVAAIGWAFSASIVVYTQTAMGFAAALLPLLLAAVHRRSFALLVLALALITTAGHPESLFLNVLVGAAYGVFELVRRREQTWRTIGIAAAAGAAALLLCAVALLPLLEAILQSYEYQQKSGAGWIEPDSNAVVLGTLATNFFPHLHVRPWIVPSLGLLPVETAAVGSIVLALALFAVWRVRSAHTWFFAALAVAGIAVGTRWPPLIDFLRSLPLMQITLMERLAFSAALALSILAAFGVDALPRRGVRPTMLALLALLGIGMFWLSRNVVLAPAYGQWRPAAELLFLALAAWRPRAGMLVALVFAQRAVSEVETFRTYPARAAYPPVPVLEPLRGVREPFRLVGRGSALPPHMNTFYGVEDPRGYEALTLAPFFATEPLWCGREARVWFNRVEDLTRPFLSFLNVRFVLQRDEESVPPGWRRVLSRDGLTLLENERVLERVFVPAQVAMTDMTGQQIVERMQDVKDFRGIAWIDSPRPGMRENGPGRITLRAYSRGGEYAFDAEMQRDGYVVISDAAWKGWRAFVDGKRVNVDRANAAFLAVHVPRGKHEVRVEYRPWTFVVGGWISLGTLLMLAIRGGLKPRPASGPRRA
ncbi:MAG TPA: YfhO family protein [Thermoanaerobaculia bacterium]|nr:YfhO family protein [Thermoanaerobaculia bacterium]